MIAKNKKRIYINIENEFLGYINELAIKNNTTKSSLITTALMSYTTKKRIEENKNNEALETIAYEYMKGTIEFKGKVSPELLKALDTLFEIAKKYE